jgi:uracil-DNA glycosylase
LPGNIDPSWGEFLDRGTMSLLRDIQDRIGNNYTPPAHRVLRFMHSDLNSLKVVILGQDPYPERGRATGRAFEVGDLKSWQAKFRQVSLKNIIRLLHKTYNNIQIYQDIKPFSVIQKEIREGRFRILPPNQLFGVWEDQGVLMLNAYLTCEIGRPGSHRAIWKGFAVDLVKYMVGKNKGLTWFLWGNDAISYSRYITSGKIYASRHPMMCSERYPDDFLKSDCFRDLKDRINWLGL